MFTEPTPETDPEMAELEAAKLLEDARREVARLQDAAELEAATGSLKAEPSLQNRIAEAEADGDWGRSAMLKMERMRLAPEASEVDPPEVAEPDQAIAQAEAAGRWLEAGQMKLAKMAAIRAATETSPTVSESDDEHILEAEHDGNWGLALRLKAEKAGIRV